MQDDTSECGESFQDSRKMYGMSRFGEKFKRSWIRKLEKLKKNIWEPTNLEKIHETRGKLNKKLQFEEQKFKNNVQISEK